MLLPETDIPHFPPTELADADGLVAFGGKLSTDWLLSAYIQGIFPWFNQGDPILWWSPDPRMVLFPHHLKIAKSMRPYFNQKKFRTTTNTSFEQVLRACSQTKRRGQKGTWITESMVEAYLKMHLSGWAHSVEVWNPNGNLVGGLYGLVIGKVFFGESMFSREKNASKFGFISWIQLLTAHGIKLIDCQIYSEHLQSLGAMEISREEFKSYLKEWTATTERLKLV
ncbi:MAG: leucyl/phenylalanyl-tRNA--protein transferase [Flavobacteriales bacterium]|nr:leucyl/phenylalanyl-tRNA--protein transferase [Flavobacteriales bacterium]